MGKEIAVWEYIDPLIAKEYLEKMGFNRRLRTTIVDRLSDEMKNKNFCVTGDSIKFDENGVLLDGQHRLQAIIKSGSCLRMLVIRGLDPKVYKKLDQGVKRNFLDFLHEEISGRQILFTSGVQPGEVEQFVYQIKVCNNLILEQNLDLTKIVSKNRANRVLGAKSERKLDFVLENQLEIDCAFGFLKESGIKICEKRGKTLLPTSIAALYFILGKSKTEEKIFEFFCRFSEDLFSQTPKSLQANLLRDRFAATHQRRDLATNIANLINLKEYMQFLSAYTDGSRPTTSRGLGQVLKEINIKPLNMCLDF